jgi:hypothetical protein
VPKAEDNKNDGDIRIRLHCSAARQYCYLFTEPLSNAIARFAKRIEASRLFYVLTMSVYASVNTIVNLRSA